MVDLSTFADNPDSERFEQSMMSVRTAGVRPIALSNRGVPKWKLEELDPVGTVSASNNVRGKLLRTYGGSYYASTFQGWWRSNSSQVLVHYDFNDPPTD